MKPITLQEVAMACCGTLHGNPDAVITSIVTDSRKAGKGSLFAAIKGARVDGHRFIPAVAEQGAVCVLCEEKPDTDIAYIKVESTLVALKGIAEYYRSLFTIPFIGITGSVGKTSTKEFISAVLAQKYNVHKTGGNFNNELGVPITLFGLEEEHEVAVIEMGISGFGEMTRLSKMVRPDICVITNIGYCHLENLGDRDGVLRAKTEMFQYLSADGTIILCHDDDKLRTVTDYHGIRPTFYGTGNDEYRAENITEKGLDGIGCTLIHRSRTDDPDDNARIDVTIPTMGRHNVLNALCAMAVGTQLGLTPEEIKRGLESFENVGSRNHIIKTDTLTIIDDCYNANPTSTKAGLDTLSKLSGRKIAILGDMKELGADEIALHREVGAYAKEAGIDMLVAVGPLSEATAEGYGKGAYYYPSVERCIDRLKRYLLPGDTILVKASHSMRFERIVEALS
ncbi:UDP-N-acetylmuramoyl-tripeptide--D-alanyl-D-alanine ligase [Roseburia sp. MSJ-14]|uniref:UDP-N-acetylmuramoyl-tripeptide--D-alanyl-D- alanine ligase n=1 Tax=Roseburia sp. MSJ-14 TaxID=2841514 RepID=UPI001C10962B|nr:UDP-N-acetylmuramoyl-tripeptide--D-alanyl-D-alanine ligase [Roseburia sp. MSJ-14]MBU5474053.1 UDP-N-acetylmuramoyl-tripeptide--D-alanyl-D-alanine ligase [Roseburia sp. MSJ-14]